MAVQVHAFDTDALGDDDAVGVAGRIRSGEITAADAVEAAISRIERVNADLHAIATPDYERARENAKRSLHGPFAGVPTIVKDNADVSGLPTGHGSHAFTPAPARDDGDFVRQYLGQGFVNVGKSRLPEFGFSASTEFLDAPPTANPWNTLYSAGASSGGSAALVASGALPIAHANDGGGSIRIPAAACGLIGLKPTRGRTRSEAMAKTMPLKIVCEGVVSRSVRDTAHFYSAAERTYANPRLPRIGLVEGPNPRRLRIGVVTESVTGRPTDAETVAAVRSTAELLAGHGHQVSEMPLPVDRRFADDFAHYWRLLGFAISSTGRRRLSADFDTDKLDTLTRGLAAAFRRHLVRTPGALLRLRRSEQLYAATFADYDIVLSPTLVHTTPTLGYLSPNQPFEQLFDRLIGYVGFTPLNNASGGPAISLPMARTANGLPIGVQFSAAHGDERSLLELAYEIEQSQGWPRIDG